MSEPIIPNSREAEEAVIGCVLLAPELVKTIDLKASDFYNKRLGIIWQALQEMNDGGIEIDFITLTNTLDAKRVLVDIGGPAYLTGLFSVVPTSMNASSYVHIVKDMSNRRGLLHLANEVAKEAYNLQKPVIEIQSGLMEHALKAAQVAQTSVPLADWMSEVYDLIDDAERNGKPAGVMTGFADYDKITGGVKTSRLEVLSGVPGMGKSILAMNRAVNLAKNGMSGVIYSIEMPSEDVSLRMLSAETGIEVSRLESGQIRENEWSVLAHAVEELSALPLYVSDAPYWTIPTLRADLSRLQAEHGISFFVLDYMDLLSDTYGQNETERTKYLSRHIRSICRDLDLHGTVIQSMVKSGFSNPSLEHLAGSVGLPYDADLVMFITEHLPDGGGEADANVRTVLIKKGRHLQRPERYFYLYKNPTLPKFGNLVKTHVDLNDNEKGFTMNEKRNGYQTARKNGVHA